MKRGCYRWLRIGEEAFALLHLVLQHITTSSKTLRNKTLHISILSTNET